MGGQRLFWLPFEFESLQSTSWLAGVHAVGMQIDVRPFNVN